MMIIPVASSAKTCTPSAFDPVSRRRPDELVWEAWSGLRTRI